MRQVPSMTNLVFAVLIVIIIQVLLYPAGLDAHSHDGTDSSGISRLISKPCKTGGYSEPEYFFVPCVPTALSNFDAICRSKNYLRAVARGNPDRPDTLTGEPCIRRWWQRYFGYFYPYDYCPSGSTCVRTRYQKCICCYGDLSDVTNTNADDPLCPDQCSPPCGHGERCQKYGNGFACLPETKPGTCPVPDLDKCWCRDDNDCAGNKKCCKDNCNVLRCQDPVDVPTTTTPEPTSSSTTESSTSSTTESSTSSTTESSTSSTTESSTSSTTVSSTSSTTEMPTDPPL